MTPNPQTSTSPTRPTGLGQQGFTLIELMVVLLILGILGALVVPRLIDRADDARVTAAKTDVNNLSQALKMYRLDNLAYPSSGQGLQALVQKPDTEPQAHICFDHIGVNRFQRNTRIQVLGCKCFVNACSASE